MSLRERKQQRAREQIVEAAFALFAERGFAQVTVTDIAERAEVGRTTFFRYFGDKQEVLFADEQRLLDAVAALPADRPAPAGLADALLELLEATAGLSELMIGDPRHYAVRERLIAANPELQDRFNRKLGRVAAGIEQLLLARGTERELALTAVEIALACFRAAHRLAGEDPAGLMPAMERVIRSVISTASPVRRSDSCQDEDESPGSSERLGQ